MAITQTISFPEDLHKELKSISDQALGGGNFSGLVVALVRIGLKTRRESGHGNADTDGLLRMPETDSDA